MIQRWILFFTVQVAIATIAVGGSAYLLSGCTSLEACDYRLAFYSIWTLVPIGSTLTSLLLPPPLRRYLAGALAAAWLLLAYIVWSGMPELPVRAPLILGAGAALSVFVMLWLKDEKAA